MRITFLSAGIFGIGGGIRATATLANALAEAGSDVEIVSLRRTWNHPKFTLHPRVRVVYLYDDRAPAELKRAKQSAKKLSDADAALASQASPLYRNDPPQDLSHINALTQQRLRAHLAHTAPQVLVSTKPLLHPLATACAPAGCAVVAHAHTPLNSYHPDDRTMTLREAARMSAVVTVTEADAAEYREQLPDDVTVAAIPNASSGSRLPVSQQDTKILMAAGRLAPVKRYHLLIKAFGRISADHPDWQLRLYGFGPREEKLRALVDKLGLGDRVLLLGRHTRLESEWPKASLSAVTSKYEAFGLTIVEAMRAGVPVVSFDCDRGPREIITSGEDGVLVPTGDVKALAAELSRLMHDSAERRRLAKRAVDTAQRYGPEPVAAQHAKLYERLIAGRRVRRRPERGRFLRPRPVAAGWFRYRHREAEVRARVASTDGRVTIGLPAGGVDSLELRHKASGTHIAVPVLPGTRTGGVSAQIRLTGEHPTGVWTVHAGTERVVADSLDTRQLCRPGDGDTHTIPFLDDDERLALRHWDTTVLAELGELRVADHGLVITAASRHARPELVLRLRSDRAKLFTVAGEPHEGAALFRLDATMLTSRRDLVPDLWDLWLREAGADTSAPAEGELAGPGERRLSRVRDDLSSKKDILLYPELPIDDSPRGPVLIRPYFTASNMLSIRVEEQPF